MRYYYNPVRIFHGLGQLSELPIILGGRTCVVVTTQGAVQRGLINQLTSLIGGQMLAVHAGVQPNPTIASVFSAFEELKAWPAEVILAIGGGSVIDTAKGVAAQYHEGLGGEWLSAHLREGQPIPDAFTPLPIIAVPTTAGTGSEVTMWATIWDEVSGRKYSLSHSSLYPEAAIVDPELTFTLPREVTVATALDALSHAMEAIWNKNANPISDALAMRAISIIPGRLKEVLSAPSNIKARKALHYASMLAGLAFSNTRTAIAHSMSYPLTAHFGLPHGIACSFTLPEILRFNSQGAEDRVNLIVRVLGCNSVEDAVRETRALLIAADTPKYLKRHLPDGGGMDSLKGKLISPERAGNNAVLVTGGGALDILSTSLSCLLE